MDDCIFCKIAKGEVPCYKVYEDDNYLAFLDVQPFTKGHILVLPKVHYANILEIPEEVLCGLMSVTKKVSIKIDKELHPSGIFINQNNGKKAGQSIMHFHMHIKPIYEDTNTLVINESREKLSEEEMSQLENILKID